MVNQYLFAQLTLVTDWVLGISRKMGLKTLVEQGFPSFFHKYLAQNEEKSCLLTHFFMAFPKPGIQTPNPSLIEVI